MSFKYLRFKPNTGPYRSGEVARMKQLGVLSLSRTFEESSHPDRSALYTIVMRKGFELSDLNEYFEHNDNVIGVSDELFETYANAPDNRQKDKHGRFVLE